MTTAEALRRGLRTLAEMRPMCVVFYVALTLAALVAVAPAMMVAYHSLGSSAWAGELSANLNIQWIGELIAGRGSLPALQVLPVFAGMLAVSLMADLFLLGGALHLFCARETFSMSGFFGGCGRNFAILIRLGLVSTIFYGAAALVWFGLSSLGDAFWGEGSAAAPLVYWSWFSAVIGLCLFGALNLVFDYARLHAVAANTPYAWRSMGASVRFVAAHAGRTAGLYAALWFLVLLAIAAYLALARMLGAPASIAILLLFLVRQLAVFAKVWLRLLFYSAQCELFDALTPKAPGAGREAPPEVVVPAAPAAALADPPQSE